MVVSATLFMSPFTRIGTIFLYQLFYIYQFLFPCLLLLKVLKGSSQIPYIQSNAISEFHKDISASILQVSDFSISAT